MSKIMSHLFLDQLDSARQTVWHKLSRFAGSFVLAGGTAIMLQIGHRRSYDFDCFSEEKLSPTLLDRVKNAFGPNIQIKTRTKDFLTVTTSDGIEVTFVWYPYKQLRKPIQTDALPLFHLDDLVTNKAFTLGRRPAWRDYVDLFIFLKWNLYSLDRIIVHAEKRFGGEFNSKLFLQQLTYWDDVDIAKTTFLKDSYTEKGIKEFLGRQVDAYLKTILP